MGNSFQVEVSESREQLQHRLRHAVTATTKERLQMLYWIKTKAIATRQELSQRLERDESTVYRWLQRYKGLPKNKLINKNQDATFQE